MLEFAAIDFSSLFKNFKFQANSEEYFSILFRKNKVLMILVCLSVRPYIHEYANLCNFFLNILNLMHSAEVKYRIFPNKRGVFMVNIKIHYVKIRYRVKTNIAFNCIAKLLIFKHHLCGDL